MADLNALIAQGVQFKAPPDPFAQYAQMQQLEQGRQANQLNRMKMDEYQRGVAEQNQLRQLDPTATDYLTQVTRVNPKLGFEFGKMQREAETAKLGQQKTQMELAEAKRKFVQQAQRDTSRNPSDANITAFKEDLMMNPMFTEQEKAQMAAGADRILAMPLSERQTFMSSQGATPGELKPTLTPQTLGGSVQIMSTPAFGGQSGVVPGSQQQVTIAPAQAEANNIARQRVELERQRVGIAQQQLNAVNSSNQLDPDAVDFLAARLLTGDTSVLTGLARTKGAVAAVQTRAAQLAKQDGLTPADVTANRLEYTGNTAGSRVIGTQIANIEIAANEANKMLDITKSYVDKVNPTEYPVLNKTGNFVARNTGDPTIVGLATSLNSLVNVYARAINPRGVATVSDKAHAREIINEAMSNGQLKEAMSVMRQEMDAALASGVSTRGAMRNLVTGKPTTDKPASAQDKQALEWANANPTDPRSAKIKAQLGVK